MEAIASEKAPKAIGPYSQAVRAGNMVFLSGQIPLDPRTGEMVSLHRRVKGLGSDFRHDLQATFDFMHGSVFKRLGKEDI